MSSSETVSPSRARLNKPPSSQILSATNQVVSEVELATEDSVGPCCRICFGDQDTSRGGTFLEPCRCRGTAKYVHERCLRQWVQQVETRKGVHRALTCDICRATYQLPRNFHKGDPLQRRVVRSCQQVAGNILNSPVGGVIGNFSCVSWYVAAAYGAFTAATRLSEMPTLLMAARYDISVLKPLVPGFSIALLMEPFISQDLAFHLETAGFYLTGWILDAVARIVQIKYVDGLPHIAKSLATAALLIPKAVGLTFQAVHLAVLCLFSGVSSGFLQGFTVCAAAPFKVAAQVANAGASFMGFIATILATVGKAAVGKVARR